MPQGNSIYFFQGQNALFIIFVPIFNMPFCIRKQIHFQITNTKITATIIQKLTKKLQLDNRVFIKWTAV